MATARGRGRGRGRRRRQKKTKRGFYERIFSLQVTLWYLIFQRLNDDRTLSAVIKDLRAGGAERLAPSASRCSAA
jgi:hypothetical protein